jgi:hypothetical protein
VPSGNEPETAAATLTGLDPGATYHYRLTIDNGTGGPVTGEDETVRSPESPQPESCSNTGNLGVDFLPDCRAWEMVSPPAKRGGDVMRKTAAIRAADDGNAISFASLTAFGDIEGTGLSAEYMSIRNPSAGGNGWVSHGLIPLQESISTASVSADPAYAGDFSSDLSTGIFKGWGSLTDDPSVASNANLYLRNDLRSPGRGTYQLVTKCPFCLEPGNGPLPPAKEPNVYPQVPALAGTSTDFSHVVFQWKRNLTADAPPQPPGCNGNTCRPRAYEWDHGEVRLVGLVPPGGALSCGPDGPACVAAAASVLGNGQTTARRRPLNVISNDGSKIIFTAALDLEGPLYLRVNGKETIFLNATERTDCADDPTCGGDGIADPVQQQEARGLYWTASADGSRIFFTSEDRLTDDAPWCCNHLYMYDSTKPPSDPHNLRLMSGVSSSGLSNASDVFAAGESGDHLYFVNRQQIVPNAKSIADGIPALIAWHDGELRFIGASSNEMVLRNSQARASFNEIRTQSRITPDGQSFLFVGDDVEGFPLGGANGTCSARGANLCYHLYLYRAERNELVCLSCHLDGSAAKTDAFTGFTTGAGQAYLSSHLNRNISDDGRYVFFNSGEGLLPEDTNDAIDAYEYDTSTATLSLLSSGTDSSDSYFAETTPDGRNAFILTRERLSGWDRDSGYDLYDARVDGGLPEPTATPAPCLGDSCRPPAPGPPNRPATGSTGIGHGNPRCQKHKLRHRAKKARKGRCGHKKHHRRHHRHIGNTEGSNTK